MKTRSLPTLVKTTLVAALVSVACTANEAPAPPGSAAAACPSGDGVAQAPVPVTPGADPTSVAHVRIFDFVGPAMQSASIDVCFQPQGAPEGSPWWGPIHRDTHTYPRYSKVAPYFDLPPGAYRMRIVPWGVAECEATLENAREDLELDTILEANTYRTIVPSGWLMAGVNGVPAMPLAVRVLTDKPTFEARQLSVRVLNMDPSIPALDVWKASKNADPAAWVLVMDNVPFGQLGTAAADGPFGATDANGYLTQQPKDWPVSIMQNIALCPHGSKENCWIVGGQSVQGNITLFASRTSASSWKYHWISDGEKLWSENQPKMTRSEDWW